MSHDTLISESLEKSKLLISQILFFLDEFCLKSKRLDQILPIHKQMFETLTRLGAM